MKLIKHSFAFCSLLILFCLFASPIYAAPSWQLQVNTAAENTLYDVQAISDLVAIGVGTDGAVSKTTDRGITWTTSVVSSAANTYYGVSFPSATTGYMVGTDNGSYGLVLKTIDEGTTWNQVYATTNCPVFYDVFFVTDDRGWAVGQADRIFKTNDGGASWTTGEPTPTPVTRLLAVHARTNGGVAPDDYNVWTTGTGGKIYFSGTGGAGITEETSGVVTSLIDVYFTDQNTGWAVGDSGVILKTTNAGTNWTAQSSGLTSMLTGIHMLDSSNGWVVGMGGKILNTTSGGSTWSDMPSPTTSDLHSVHFYDAYNGWAVGGGSRVVAKYGGPSIDSASPNSGVVGWTGDVNISGSNFMSALTATNVSFGADITVNTVTVNSSTSLTVNITIASGAAIGARTITVTNLDQMSGTGIGAFTVQSAGVNPTVTSVSPSFLSQGATDYLVLTGTNFEAGMTVAIDGVTVNSVSVTSSTNANINVTVPAGTLAGAKNVTVTTSTGSGILSNGFTVVSATGGPAVSTMSPLDWAYQNTASLRTSVVGSGFLSGATVQLSGSGIAVSGTSVNATGTEIAVTLTVASDAAVGRRDVIVTNPDSTVGISANVFEVRSSSPGYGERIRSVIGGPCPFMSRDPDTPATLNIDISPDTTFPTSLIITIFTPDGRLWNNIETPITEARIWNITFYPNRPSPITGESLPNGIIMIMARINGFAVEKTFRFTLAR